VVQIEWRIVTPGYFQAAGVPLVEGRPFDASDRFTPGNPAERPESLSMIISRWLARRLWEGRSDPLLALPSVQPLTASLAGAVAGPRFSALVLGTFAAAALLVACLGIYAVIAFSVARRTREIALRMALGAAPRTLLSIILRRSMALTAAGIGLGAGAARPPAASSATCCTRSPRPTPAPTLAWPCSSPVRPSSPPSCWHAASPRWIRGRRRRPSSAPRPGGCRRLPRPVRATRRWRPRSRFAESSGGADGNGSESC
jgi:FtsX-like permease family